jgi:hypothetical protein
MPFPRLVCGECSNSISTSSSDLNVLNITNFKTNTPTTMNRNNILKEQNQNRGEQNKREKWVSRTRTVEREKRRFRR